MSTGGEGRLCPDLHDRRGEVFGYLGPNGAGKTTTIRSLLGFMNANGGSAPIMGKDCRKYAAELQRDIDDLPAEIACFWNMTGMEFLTLIGDLRHTRSSLVVGSAIPILFFVTRMISNLGEQIEWLRYLSLYSFVDVTRLLSEPDYVLVSSAILLPVSLALFVTGVIVFDRRSLAIRIDAVPGPRHAGRPAQRASGIRDGIDTHLEAVIRSPAEVTWHE